MWRLRAAGQGVSTGGQVSGHTLNGSDRRPVCANQEEREEVRAAGRSGCGSAENWGSRGIGANSRAQGAGHVLGPPTYHTFYPIWNIIVLVTVRWHLEWFLLTPILGRELQVGSQRSAAPLVPAQSTAHPAQRGTQLAQLLAE